MGLPFVFTKLFTERTVDLVEIILTLYLLRVIIVADFESDSEFVETGGTNDGLY